MNAVGEEPRQPRPLRIVVAGSSVAMYVRPYRRDRADGTYAELLEQDLWDRGVPAELTNQAGWLHCVSEIFHEVDRRVLAHVPDVVILNVGWVECQPRLVPLRVLRWQESWRPSLHPAAGAVRRGIAPPLRALHRRAVPKVLEHLPWPMHRMSPDRFEAELRRLVNLIRREQQCLVLLLNVNPTSDRIAAALPGIHEHTERFSGIVDAVAAGSDEDVRVIDTRSLVERFGVEQLLPDGIHFNAQGHRLVADLVLDEVDVWQRRTDSRADTAAMAAARIVTTGGTAVETRFS